MTNTKPNIGARIDFTDEHGWRELIVHGYRPHLCARGLSDGTVRVRLHHIDQVHAEYPDLAAVTTQDLEAFLAARRERLKPESRRNLRMSLRVFFEWGHKARHFEHNPAADLRPIRIPRTAARIADDSQLLTALRTASLPEKAMVLLGRDACLRLSEIAKLHTDEREGDVLYILGKGGHTRNVPVGPDLLQILKQLERAQGPGYYFPGRFGGCIHPQSLNKIITRVTGTNPHSLRHAGGTAAYRKGGDIRAVQELLGHVSLSTTQRYVHVGLDEVRAAAAQGALGFHQPEALSVFDRVAFDSVRGVAAAG